MTVSKQVRKPLLSQEHDMQKICRKMALLGGLLLLV